jgi:hypothetical protein
LEAPFERTLSRTVFVLLLLASISFDGVLSTPQWTRFEHRIVSVGDLHGQELLRCVSFVVIIAALYLIFGLFALAVTLAGGRQWTLAGTLSGLLPSMVPIAFGYLLAHYLQYVLINGQLILPLLGAPGGEATSLHLPYPFNDNYDVHTRFLPNGFYWYFDLVVIVAAHIAAVVLAHRHLVRTATAPAPARRAEYRWIIAGWAAAQRPTVLPGLTLHEAARHARP